MSPSLFVPSLQCNLSSYASSAPLAQKRVTVRRRRPTARPDARAVSSLAIGENLVATVAHIGGADSAWLDINVATLRGKAVHARLRLLSKSSRGARKVPPAGEKMAVRVARLNVPAARVEVVPAWELSGASPPEALYKLEELKVGQQLRGVVVAVVAAGAVVDVCASRAAHRGARSRCFALLRRAHFAPKWASSADTIIRDDAERVIAQGDVLDLYVREANVHSARLFLCASLVTEEQLIEERRIWRQRIAKRNRRKSANSLSMGERRTGTVRDVQKYGCFVDVGVKSDGLIHSSDMGEHYSRTWKTEVCEGVKVVVEVVKIHEQRLNLRLIGLEGDEFVEDKIENFATARASRPNSSVASNSKGAPAEIAMRRGEDGEVVDGDDVEKGEEEQPFDYFGGGFTDDGFEAVYIS